MVKGNHRGNGGGGNGGDSQDKPKNTKDPQTCAHIGHTNKKSPHGPGRERYCKSCNTLWYTP